MRDSNDKSRMRARHNVKRVLADSTRLFQTLIEGVEFGIKPDNFFIQEMGRLIQDGATSFEDEDFHYLIKQGIRLDVNPNVDLRAELSESLRRACPDMKGPARRIARTVIGAVEDVDFSLDVVGTVVHGYTTQLLKALERDTYDDGIDAQARVWVEQWAAGGLDRQDLLNRFCEVGSEGVPAVADLLLDTLDDAERVETALDLLAAVHTPVAAQMLAHVVSEPILEEHQEERARKILKDLWGMAIPYVLYNLRRHIHEDIPFRWLELLIETDYTRAVDRILEEVVAHARSASHREDLLSLLPLLDRSNDPGVVGKLLRLLAEGALSDEALELIEQWVGNSPLAEAVEEALQRVKDGKTILVRRRDDFSAFAGEQAARSLAELRDDWNAAYHESLGWQQRNRIPRGPIETRYEFELEEAMIERLSLNPRLDEDALRDQMEHFRETWLVTPQSSGIPLVAIFLERESTNPWLEEIYWNEINSWYIKAAQYFDEGATDMARHYLDVILKIEPGYPFARMLDRIMTNLG